MSQGDSQVWDGRRELLRTGEAVGAKSTLLPTCGCQQRASLRGRDLPRQVSRQRGRREPLLGIREREEEAVPGSVSS